MFYEELVHCECCAILNLGCIFNQLTEEERAWTFDTGQCYGGRVCHSMNELNGVGVIKQGLCPPLHTS